MAVKQQNINCIEVLAEVTDLVKIVASQFSSNGENFKQFIRLARMTSYSDKISRRYISGLMARVADITLNGVISRLGAAYPRLTDEDLGFCSMLVLNFSKGSIKMVFQQSNDQSYYNRRNKIGNKIGLFDKGSLEEYILSVSAEHPADG